MNRISIGVQSLDDDVLAILGRAHDSERAREAVRMAKDRFENVSVDVMCGIPGQSKDSLRATIEEAVALGAKHVSVYPLAVEEHTPLYRAMLAGDFPEPDEDMQADHMELAASLLQECGFARFEIASYALPGFQSRHNTAYWTGKPYIGLGQSATTMTQNAERRMRMTDGEVEDMLDRPQMEAEDLMLGMRLVNGISDERLAVAQTYLPDALLAMEGLRDEGYVEHVDGRWRPTLQGWLCGNDLFERLLELA